MTEQRNLARFATIANAAFNSMTANSTAITSMSIGGHTINATSFAGTANNANNLGGIAAASYQLNSALAANVATMTANNATNLGGVAAASYQLNSTLAANVATLTSNNTSFVGTVTAANVVSNAQLSANLANYQTTAGLAANVATLTANNASFLGGTAAASYQLNSTLSTNVATMTANNASNLGGVAAASYALLAGPTFTGAVNVTGNVIATGIVSVGNSTVNAFANSTHLVFNSTTAQAIGIFKPTANGSRIDIVSGANNASNPFWNGIHIGPPGAFANATSGTAFPRVSHFYSFTNTTNPSDLTYNIIPGNDGGIGTALKLYSVSTSGVTNGIDIVSNGNVGIGTSTPGGRLNVSSNRAAVAYSQVWTVFNGGSFENDVVLGYQGTHTFFGNFQNNPLTFITNNAERMRLTAAGDLVVGTTVAGARIHAQVASSGTFQNAFFASNGVDSDFAVRIRTSTTEITNAGVGAALALGTSGTERMRIDSSGNIGIATTGPVCRLEVAANNPTRGIVAQINNLGTTGQTGSQLSFLQNNVNWWTIGQPAATDAFVIWRGRHTSGDGTELMRINSSGFVGINTSSPSVHLDVIGAIRGRDEVAVTNASPEGGRLRVINSSKTGNTTLDWSIWNMTGGYGNGLSFWRYYANGTNAGSAMFISDDGNLLFNSGFGSIATAYGCRAWVNFNGTGTVAIRGSGNVSSITDNGLGDYTVNFANAMPDTNYAVAGFASNNGDDENETFTVSGGATTTYSTTALRISTTESYGGVTSDADSPRTSVVIFR